MPTVALLNVPGVIGRDAVAIGSDNQEDPTLKMTVSGLRTNYAGDFYELGLH